MHFLFPTFLYGFIFSTIPVLLHLISKRRVRQIPFSSIAHLKELQKDRIRSLKIREILLLIVRTLIIIFIILAFARPALRGKYSSGSRITAVILIDRSLSMGYGITGDRDIDKAKQKALQVLELFKEKDEVAVIAFDSRPDFISEGFTGDFSGLKEKIPDIDAAHAGTNDSSAISQAVSLLNSKNTPSRELYLISDMHFPFMGDTLEVPENPPALFLLPVDSGGRQNVSLDRVYPSEELLRSNRPVPLILHLTNTAKEDIRHSIVNVNMNGEKRAQKLISIPAQTSFVENILLRPEGTGKYHLQVSIEDDLNPLDNHVYASLAVPEKIRVLLIYGSKEDRYYIREVLNPQGEMDNLFQVKEVNSSGLDKKVLNWGDVIVLASVPELSMDIYNTIKELVQSDGRGLLIFLGEGIQPDFYRETVFRELFPCEIESFRSDSSGSVRSFERWDWLDKEHPVFRSLWQDTNPDSPKFSFYHACSEGSMIRPIVRYGSGKTAVGVSESGMGRVMTVCAGADIKGGDFPLKGVFVPFVIRSVRFLAGISDETVTYEVHEKIMRKIPGLSPVETIICEGPVGEVDISVIPKAVTGGVLWEVDGLELPGFYSLKSRDHVLDSFLVNHSSSENKHKLLNREELLNRYRGMNIQWIENEQSAQTANAGQSERLRRKSTEKLINIVNSARYGKELYPYIIIFVLLLAAIEMFVVGGIPYSNRRLKF